METEVWQGAVRQKKSVNQARGFLDTTQPQKKTAFTRFF